MDDKHTTVKEMTDLMIDLVKFRGWAEDGVQNPINVVMAMSTEMGELLEHFAWIDNNRVQELMRGEDPKELDEIGAEVADVTAYMLQLCYALNIDLAQAFEKKMNYNKTRVWE